jgi:hypothetical protein
VEARSGQKEEEKIGRNEEKKGKNSDGQVPFWNISKYDVLHFVLRDLVCA